jgi:hypothetical protein
MMEASGGIPAAESGQEQGQAGSEATQAPESGGIDRLHEAFEKFSTDFGSWRQDMDAWREAQAQPEAEPEPEPDEPDFNEYFNEAGQITPEDLQQWIDHAAEQKAQQFTKPLQEQMSQAQAAAEQRRLEQAADELEQRYPRLSEPEWQDRVVDAAMQVATEAAQAAGDPQLAEVIWRQPGFLENIHLAMEARERAENEVPAGSESGFPLERGGSVHPSGGDLTNEDIVSRIVNAKG